MNNGNNRQLQPYQSRNCITFDYTLLSVRCFQPHSNLTVAIMCQDTDGEKMKGEVFHGGKVGYCPPTL